MRATPPRVPSAFLEDKDAQGWLGEPCRIDPANGQLIWYEGWSQVGGSTGHTVRRLQEDRTWGPPFVMTRAEISRTQAAGILAEGIAPPC